MAKPPPKTKNEGGQTTPPQMVRPPSKNKVGVVSATPKNEKVFILFLFIYNFNNF